MRNVPASMSDPSAPTSRVERKRRARRERIVDAAVSAVAELGPGEFSLNQLARDLDYTPGALYWYFASKEALVLEVQRRVFTDLTRQIVEGRRDWAEARSIANQPFEVRCLYSLLRQAAFYLRLETTDRDVARIIAFSLDPRQWLDEEHAQDLTPVLAGLFQVSAEGFVEAHEGGVLKEGGTPAHRAVQYWASLQGLLQTEKLTRINPDLFRVFDLGMDSSKTLLAGWGAPRAALEQAFEKAMADGSSD